jgi:hypothetical protein
MCLRRAPEKYIAGAKAPAGAALDRADLDSWLKDNGTVVSPMHRQRSTSHEHYFPASDIHFL